MSLLSRRTFMAAAAAATVASQYRTSASSLRLGIIGSDNSHAIAFASLCNKGDGDGRRIENAVVTHLWGEDSTRTVEVAEAGAIPNIVANPEDMLGKVDGVLCVRRHGKFHYSDAKPFIEAGLPVFVDKPLTCDPAEAESLVALARGKGVPFSSFSTLRYSSKTVAYLQGLSESTGSVVAGTVTGPCDISSEYGGVYFYGIHVVDLMCAAFGYDLDVEDVSIVGKNVSVLCSNDSTRLITLHLVEKAAYGFHLTALGEKGYSTHTVDSGDSYYEGLKVILEGFRTGEWPLSEAQLIKPVQLLSKISQSLATV